MPAPPPLKPLVFYTLLQKVNDSYTLLKGGRIRAVLVPPPLDLSKPIKNLWFFTLLALYPSFYLDGNAIHDFVHWDPPQDTFKSAYSTTFLTHFTPGVLSGSSGTPPGAPWDPSVASTNLSRALRKPHWRPTGLITSTFS